MDKRHTRICRYKTTVRLRTDTEEELSNTFHFALILVLMLSSSISTAIDQIGQQVAPLLGASSPDRIEGRYIVVFRDDAPADAFKRATAVGGVAVFHEYTACVNGFAAELSDKALQTLRENPDVAYVEADRECSTAGDQSSAPWGLDRIDQRDRPLDSNYHWDYSGTGVRAYILDTGIRINHPEFGGRAIYGENPFNYVPPIPDEPLPPDDDSGNSHGTLVAGIVGGSTYGVAKDVELVAVKVCNSDNTCPVSVVNMGIEWVTKNHQLNPDTPSVANMSLGVRETENEGDDHSPTIRACVQKSIDAGVVYVVAAMNDDEDACDWIPADVTDAITVGATNDSDKRALHPDQGWGSGQGSNYGACVDLFAPGTLIESAVKGDPPTSGYGSGTSMAAPLAAGVAAQILEANNQATPAEVADMMIAAATSDRLSDIGHQSPNLLLFSNRDAQYVNQVVPSAMYVNSEAQVWVKMRNNGTTVWKRSQGFRLGSQPAGDDTWGLTSVDLPRESVLPGGAARLDFNIVAPGTPGDYIFQWQMLQGQTGWFGDKTPDGIEITVLPPACAGTEHKWQSDFDGQAPYLSMDQPNPPVCLDDSRCLHSSGVPASLGTVSGYSWLCSAAFLEGRQQGVWYQCETSRIGKVIEGSKCSALGGFHRWVPVR